MKLSTVITRLTKEYEKAKKDKHVRKPMSFALYQTWRWTEIYEKERTVTINNEK